MNDFKITSSAASRLQELRKRKGVAELILRIEVQSGGCSGFQYKYDFDAMVAEDDVVIEVESAKVIIDRGSLDLISTSELDYVVDLGSASFQIRNPQATAKCSCGNSFAV